ncbi:MAG: hypothetical protein ACOY0S_00465, partial [Patescibacteria group bacterium]
PSVFDIEPTCFSLDPTRALSHAYLILERSGIAKENVQIAVGLVIPSATNPDQILYGRRDPLYHTEYQDTWGLPSTGISQEEFLAAGVGGAGLQPVPSRIGERKLGGLALEFDQVVGWAGRLRLTGVDPQFARDYYLILVDVQTKPIVPSSVPGQTVAYREFRWLTPQEQVQLVLASPKKACGACSELATLAARLGKI